MSVRQDHDEGIKIMGLQNAAKTKIQEAADRRKPFVQGNVRAEWYDAGVDVPKGRMRPPYSPVLNNRGEVFVIFSYGTPIAWFTEYNGWEIPGDKYSVTTTNHQNVVRTAIDNPSFYAGARW